RRAKPHDVLDVRTALREHHRIRRLVVDPGRGVAMLLAHRLRGDEPVAVTRGKRRDHRIGGLALVPAAVRQVGQNHSGSFSANVAAASGVVKPPCMTRGIRQTSEMLTRRGSEPAFFAPFVSSAMRVEPGWIDYNGHLNMAYYNVLFDRAVDEVYELLGCGLDYLKEKQHSCYTAEVHLRYLRELRAGDPVRVTFQLLDFDSK